MNVYEGKSIRNVGIVGHGGSGKTSLIVAVTWRATDSVVFFGGGSIYRTCRDAAS